MNDIQQIAPDVFASRGPRAAASGDLIPFLKEHATASARMRARWCAHPSTDSAVHEMVIALANGAYIPPHRHPGRSESIHVLEGTGALVFFDDSGTPQNAIPLVPPSGQGIFFHRIDEPIFHTVLVFSQHLVFHETIQGPFIKRAPERVPWAPSEDDADGIRAWLRGLHQFCREKCQ